MRTCVVSQGARLIGGRLMIKCKAVKRACLAPQVGRLELHQLARNLTYDMIYHAGRAAGRSN